MTEQIQVPSGARVLLASDGRSILRSVGHVSNRFMIDGADTGGRLAVLQHLFEPRALAAPMHRHHDEDEYTYVLIGRIGAILGDEEVFGGPGDRIFKPRGQWHTFWNAGDEPAKVLEIISPAGLEELFRSFGDLAGEPDPKGLADMAGRYHCDLDFPATMPVVQRHALLF
jgi:mannose-6-phosphate isomerase-like protein (cupin superfamily)